jgi:hypothetical protein
MHPYSSKAFQWYQKHDDEHYGLEDINVTRQNPKKKKKQSFLNR